MTEYDYSPEAYERFMEKQRGIADWVDKTNRFQTTPPRRSTGFDSDSHSSTTYVERASHHNRSYSTPIHLPAHNSKRKPSRHGHHRRSPSPSSSSDSYPSRPPTPTRAYSYQVPQPYGYVQVMDPRGGPHIRGGTVAPIQHYMSPGMTPLAPYGTPPQVPYRFIDYRTGRELPMPNMPAQQVVVLPPGYKVATPERSGQHHKLRRHDSHPLPRSSITPDQRSGRQHEPRRHNSHPASRSSPEPFLKRMLGSLVGKGRSSPHPADYQPRRNSRH